MKRVSRSGARVALVALRVWPASPAAAQTLAIEPLKDSGSNVYPAFEGWYQNADGTYTLLIGYYNRNKKQVLDIPIGPENRIEPGGPDQGQPTHFTVGRGWGTIAIKVPKDFGDKKLTWTLTANGRTVSVPFGITKGYQIEPFLDAAMGNKPPRDQVRRERPRADRSAAAAVCRARLQRRGWRGRDPHLLGDRRRPRRAADRRIGRRAASRPERPLRARRAVRASRRR